MSQAVTVKEHVSLHDKNWFGTGGAARYFAEPDSAQQMQQAIAFAREHALPCFILGEGANVLISNEGFAGLVIKPALKHITVDAQQARVTAGAGVSIHELIAHCFEHKRLGLEEFSGIPGTVGGSVFINLHYFEFLLADFLVNAQIIEHATGNVIDVDRAWFNFGYNHSRLHERTHYLLEATFQLRQANEQEVSFARGRAQEIIRHRVKRYPSKLTCGSFFRNFHEDEVKLIINGKPMIHVAYYLDKLGIKGELRVGDAMVSWQHANMLVNLGNATSDDIIQLARTIQQKTFDAYGIIPQPECLLVGFNDYPLMLPAL